MKEKKILVVDFNGTSPTYTHYFSSELAKRDGIEIKVLGYKNVNDLKIHSNLISYVGIDVKNKLLNYFLNWCYLIVIGKSFEVIHIQWLPFLKHSGIDLFFLKLLKKRNKNVFYTVHNFYPHNEVRENVINRYNKLYSILDNLVVHTDETRNKIVKLNPQKKIIRIFHGLFYSGFEKTEIKESNTMVMLGMISPYKGFEDAITIVKKIIDKGYNLKLHIEGAGSIEYIDSLRKMVKDFNIEDNVVIISGYIDVNRLIELYEGAFTALMPYKKIEQSGVVFTSFGLKTPVVAYNVGGLGDIIMDGANGKLVSPGDLNEFQKAIIWTYRNQKDLQSNLRNDNKTIDLWNETGDILIEKYFKISSTP